MLKTAADTLRSIDLATGVDRPDFEQLVRRRGVVCLLVLLNALLVVQAAQLLRLLHLRAVSEDANDHLVEHERRGRSLVLGAALVASDLGEGIEAIAFGLGQVAAAFVVGDPLAQRVIAGVER